MMDTGAGWSGVLSMMDIDTKRVFISEHVPSLYPGVKGRTMNNE
jgi:serine/threonine protein phosphatase 1